MAANCWSGDCFMKRGVAGTADIFYLVLDIDGTLTDGKIYMGANGEVVKAFDVKDGYAICEMLPPVHISPIVLTGRESEIVRMRCTELGIERVCQGVSDKLAVLSSIVNDEGRSLANVAYMGDDLNDLKCMMAVKDSGGLVACPQDAADAVREVSGFVSSRRGGDGAVREFVEWLISFHMNGGASSFV